ncbi:integral membrane protein [Botrytis cinerea]
MRIPPPQILSTFPQPNYIDPVTRGPVLLIITVVFLPIIYIVVGLRTFTRTHLSKHFGIDDVFLLIALVPTTACAVIALLAQERWKWNRHIWDVAPDDAEFGLKISLLLECLFGLAVALTKISLLILVMRVMSRGTGLLKHLAIAMIVIVACEAIAFDVVIICTALPATKPFFSTFLPSLFGHNTQPSDESLYKLSAHNPSKARMHPSHNEFKPEESFNIGDISDPMAENTEIPDYVRRSRQMLPLSYLSFQSSNRRSSNQRSSLQRSSNPPSYHHQSYQTYNTRDMEFDEASLSIGSYLGRRSARLTQQSDRTYQCDRSSINTFVTEEPGSPHSSRFASSLMEVPYSYNQFGRAHELRPSESQDVLIHAR